MLNISSIGHFLFIGISLFLILLLDAFNEIANLYFCFSEIYLSILGNIPEVEIVIFLLLKLNPKGLLKISHA